MPESEALESETLETETEYEDSLPESVSEEDTGPTSGITDSEEEDSLNPSASPSSVIPQEETVLSEDTDWETLCLTVENLNQSMETGFTAVCILLGFIAGLILIKHFFVWRANE
jgi:hypothetical protein